MKRRPFFIIGAVLMAIACGTQIETSITDDASDAGAEAAARDADAPMTDGGADADADFDPYPITIDESGCPRGRGPKMVVVSNYCIDETEVSRTQFAQMRELNADASDFADCRGKTTLGPSFVCDGNRDASLPARCVDWCDAQFYCRWAGKRLCGGRPSGATPYNAFTDRDASEWMNACKATVGGSPYGASDVSNCAANTTAPRPVGDADCQQNGVFDLSGNVAEWENSCEDSGATTDQLACRIRGGAYNDNLPSTGCADERTAKRIQQFPWIGIRCCADIAP